MNKYYIYIVTDKNRLTLKIGATGSLRIKLDELADETTIETENTCKYLVYWECHENARETILRERALNKLSKKKKIELVNSHNPEWEFLNKTVSIL
jgi:putative endonuclease